VPRHVRPVTLRPSKDVSHNRAMGPFSIHTTLTLADWHALQRVCGLRVQQATAGKTWRVVALWFAVAFATCAIVDVLDIELSVPSLVLGVVLIVAIVMAAHKRSLKAAQPREGGAYLSPCDHVLSAEGITSTQRGAHSFSQWQRVTEVTATTEHIFIWLDTLMAYVIPVRDLPEGVSADLVVAACKEWMAAPVAQESVSPPSDTPAAPVVMKQTESAWRTAFRLLTLRSIANPASPASALSGKTLPMMALALFSFALWVALSRYYYMPTPTFMPYSVTALSWYVLAVLAVAFAMARGSRPQVAVSRVCSLLSILLPLLIVADFVIVMWVPESWGSVAVGIVALYSMVYCARGLHALAGDRQPLAVLGGAAVATLFLWVASALYVYPAVWTIEEGPEEYADQAEADEEVSEALLFEQPARIDASVARVQRATGDAPAGFFVGFAGHGEQRVFAEEIEFAAQKFANRYDTADRTLLLLNDRRDREAQPLATVAGLNYALKAVAAKMRLDQDVLFLALSSHGSQDPLLSVENGMLPLRDLTGAALADALKASGIKWRVIVISACHSGAFIESLKDPYTIVITAAAPDRTSFGCSDDRDLTYFGEAFFRDAFPQATSLREAFDSATKLVSEREAGEGFEASNPQAFFGDQIEPRIVSMLRPASSP